MSVFKKADKINSAGKFLVYSPTGDGKSTFALTFPKVFAFDSEQGLNFYLNNENLLQVAPTASMYEMQDGIDELNNLIDTDKDAVKTILFDSETKFYQNIQDTSLKVEENRARDKNRDVDDANLSMRSWGRIKAISNRLQSMKIDMASRGVNVVSTAHQADIKEEIGGKFVVVGNKPDTYKTLPFDYDIILRLYTTKDKKTNKLKYFAEILKDRTSTFKKHDTVENPSYEMWADKFNTDAKENETDYATDTKEDTDKMMEEENEADKVKTLVAVLKKAIKKAPQNKKLEVAKVLKDNNTDSKGLSKLSMEKVQIIKKEIVAILTKKDDGEEK